jgi:membrane protease YdiL (CAAX protease family)
MALQSRAADDAIPRRAPDAGAVTPRQAMLFYGIAIGLATTCAALIRWTGAGPLVILFMYTPLIAVLAAEALTARQRLRRLPALLAIDRGGWRAWPFALLAPPAVIGASTLALVALGVAQFAAPDAAPGSFAAAIIVHLALGMVWAFGEETGWRGYLLPGLLGLGLWPALLLSGFLHGLWHLPLMLMTTVYLAEGARWIVVPGFLAIITLAGVAYGFVRLTSGSLWPAVAMHAAFNEWLAQSAVLTTTTDPARRAYLGGETGLFSILAMVALAIWIARRWPEARAGRLA